MHEAVRRRKGSSMTSNEAEPGANAETGSAPERHGQRRRPRSRWTRELRVTKRLGLKFVKHAQANVIAYLALFFAMGGTATAATAVIITSQDQVGTATISSRAIADGSVAPIDLVKPEAWRVVGASGQPAFNTYSCGTGNTCEWKSALGGTTEFSEDAYGIVHLRISMCWSARFTFQPPGAGSCTTDGSGSGHAAFRLPAGYRPAFNLNFNGLDATNSTAGLAVGSGGSVTLYNFSFSASDPLEITFRADA